MSMLHAGTAAVGPYLSAAAGVMFGGWWGDWMIWRGVSVSTTRKLPMVIGLLLTGTIVLANFTTSNAIVIGICVLHSSRKACRRRRGASSRRSRRSISSA